MTTEIWKQIPGFGGHYDASSLGRVRVRDRVIVKRHSTSRQMTNFHYAGRILQGWSGSDGYRHFHIGVSGVKVVLRAHHAVLLAFVGPAPHGTEGCHNNGNASDNRLENLRWDTHLANNGDRLVHDTYTRGSDHPMVKFSEADIREIRSGSVSCKEAMHRYGISRTHFHRVRKGDSWAHL